MTQRTVPNTRPAPQRRPGVRGGSSWRVPLGLVILSLMAVVAGSLRLLEVAGGPQLMPTNPRRRDIPAHRAWMVHAYALGVGAGTQAFTQGIGEALFGTSDVSTAISVGSGWAINAVVAEWVIQRPAVRRAARARAYAALAGAR
jgi:hypothetical protein